MADSTYLSSAGEAAAQFDLPRPAADCRIVVAMSGGVDSSVVAALLQRAIRLNEKSQELWREYLRFELLHASKMRERANLLGTAVR